MFYNINPNSHTIEASSHKNQNRGMRHQRSLVSKINRDFHIGVLLIKVSIHNSYWSNIINSLFKKIYSTNSEQMIFVFDGCILIVTHGNCFVLVLSRED